MRNLREEGDSIVKYCLEHEIPYVSAYYDTERDKVGASVTGTPDKIEFLIEYLIIGLIRGVELKHRKMFAENICRVTLGMYEELKDSEVITGLGGAMFYPEDGQDS